jgi:ribonuclease VapC
MFVDASALVAILLEEDEGRSLAQRIETASVRLTSPLAIYEAVTAVNRVHAGGIKLAEARVRAFLQRAGIAVLAIEDTAATSALEAQARFGERSTHPAKLNMGDCFAYAMAKQRRVPLLYKGDDFAQTDLA